ncbi:MAG: hypothetical protein FWG39_00875 [Alphaproteobacteria bacterium]|nr:hypothetical protein [Alphaproteobacteria bacterium]
MQKIKLFTVHLVLICGATFSFVPPAYSIIFDNVQDADFMDLVMLARADGSDNIVLRNSKINFNLGYASPIPVTLQGYVVFVMPDMPAPGDYLMLSNVSNDSCCVAVYTGFSQMFDANFWWNEKDMMLSVSRITDYERILGNDVGRFINFLKNSGANPELISQLDGAMSMEQLTRIMDNSVSLRPAKLMNPVKLLMRLEDVPRAKDGAFGAADIIFGDDLVLYSASAGIGLTSGGLSFGASVRAGKFSNFGIEEYSGTFYGLDIHGGFDTDYFYAATVLGAYRADLSAGPLHDGNSGATYNPSGMAFHGAVEIGAKAFKRDGFQVAPIIRAAKFYARVLHDSDSENTAGAGARIGYMKTDMGIESSYGVYGIMEKDGGQFGVRTDIKSPRDGLSLHLEAAVLDSDFGRFYKLGAGVRLDF